MAEKKAKAPKPPETITISRQGLDAALNENSIRKLGSQPVEGQLDDLWARLGGK